jgi:hypothetical protein
MEPRISLIALGVADLPRARAFYPHWKLRDNGSVEL